MITFEDKGDEVLIEAKCPPLRDVFEKISNGRIVSSNSRWQHLELFDLPIYPYDTNYHMGKVGTASFIDSSRINLSFLRATELDEGISLTLVGGDYPEHRWEDVKYVTFKAIKDVLRRHFVPKSSFELLKDGAVERADENEAVPVQMKEISGNTRRFVVGEDPTPEPSAFSEPEYSYTTTDTSGTGETFTTSLSDGPF